MQGKILPRQAIHTSLTPTTEQLNVLNREISRLRGKQNESLCEIGKQKANIESRNNPGALSKPRSWDRYCSPATSAEPLPNCLIGRFEQLGANYTQVWTNNQQLFSEIFLNHLKR
jgi:hypothetical protein